MIGIDDAGFDRQHRGDVPIVGVVCAGSRIDGVLISRVRRDGANATRQIAQMVCASRFAAHLQLVLLEGIAVAGFNVIDVGALAKILGLAVLVVCRRKPDLAAIKRALLHRVPGGAKKWLLVEKAGLMEKLGSLWVQRVGLSADHAQAVIAATALYGHLPEPVRLAHLFASSFKKSRAVTAQGRRETATLWRVPGHTPAPHSTASR